QIQGVIDPAANVLSGPDLVDPDLINLTGLVAPEERYSFIFRGSAQALDHALISETLSDDLRGFMFGRGNADAPLLSIERSGDALRSSDHDGLVAYFTTDLDGDGVPNNVDLCPNTVVPETTTSGTLRGRRMALFDDDFVFDTGISIRGGEPQGNAGARPSTIETQGCSCNQILDFQGDRANQRKFGCTPRTIRRWIQATSKYRLYK
ncbi:MAG: hypothetical protein AAAFM81_02060, partial [Pseudomonadota bacterium]